MTMLVSRARDMLNTVKSTDKIKEFRCTFVTLVVNVNIKSPNKITFSQLVVVIESK